MRTSPRIEAGIMQIEKLNRRNVHGVKESFDMYRTIRGAHYVCWMSFPSEDRIREYRAAGIPCARRGEELFVHHMYTADATAIDAKHE